MTKSKRVVGLRNQDKEGVNPKDRIGATKVDVTLIPASAIAEEAYAMMDGEDKYGAYNWRVEPVLARTYVAAAIRHLLDWLDGEEYANDSLAHHLAHARACCGILIDAQYQGTLTDNRPIQNNTKGDASTVFTELALRLKAREAMKQQEVEGTSELGTDELDTRSIESVVEGTLTKLRTGRI